MGEGLKRARKAAKSTRVRPDIVVLLRKNAKSCALCIEPIPILGPVMDAAADEIERLRTRVAELEAGGHG